MLPTVTLEVDGYEYGGLVSAVVTRNLEDISGQFSITYTELWPGLDTPWPLLPHKSVRLLFGDHVLINGYIDGFRGSLTESTLQAIGRDNTGQLVDCSPRPRPTQYLGIAFERLAQVLCAPYNILVENQVGRAATRAIPVVRIQPGQSVFSLLEEEARRQQVLLGPTPEGNVRIWRPGDVQAAQQLIQGETVETCEWVDDWSQRYSEYFVEAQNDVLVELQLQSFVRGVARDESVELPRLLRIRADLGGDVPYATRRAQWEANSRAARSKMLTVRFPHFLQQPENPNSPIWEVGQLVYCDIPKAKIQEQLLIQQISYNFSGNDFGVTMQLIRRDAWLPMEPRPRVDLSTGQREVPLYD